MKHIFYHCGICEHLHPWEWNGDCRDDDNRFTYDELDKMYGPYDWEERTMEDRVNADLNQGINNILEMSKRIAKLETSLQVIRDENNRAKRQFTNVSNKLIEEACKVLDENDQNT